MNEDEKIEEIRKLAKQGKIVFAPQEQRQYLDDYIRQILEALAEVMKCRGMAKAWVSDQSTISDFCHCDGTCTRTEEGFCECQHLKEMAQLKEILGVEVKIRDYLVNIARRMAGLI